MHSMHCSPLTFSPLISTHHRGVVEFQSRSGRCLRASSSTCRASGVQQSTRIVPFLNPDKQWEVDEAHIDVLQEQGSICHAVMRARVEADPHRVFQLFERSDYDAMFEIFKLVKLHQVVRDDGAGKKEVDLEFDAKWSFWKVSGTCFIPISMKMDKSTGKINFHQKKPGFLTLYEGRWTIMALSKDGTVLDPEDFPWFLNGSENQIEKTDEASLVTLELTVKPSITPPPPINRLLKGNTSDQVESLFRDLKIELNKDSRLKVDSILRGQF